MSLMHQPRVWGYLIGVTVLGCLAGCSLKYEPEPRPRTAAKKATPAPRAPAPPAQQEAAPAEESTTVQMGRASWYGPGFHGRATASGERFKQDALTAAHPTLPLGTEAKVTNVKTGQSVTVKINDRGPHVPGRHLDLSKAAAQRIR